MKPVKLLLAVLLVCGLLLAPSAAHALNQPVLNFGLTNVLDGAAPPPGLYLSMYTVLETAQSVEAKMLEGSPFQGAVENLDITVAAIAPQIIWVSPWHCPLSGGNFGFQGFPILGSISVDDPSGSGNFPVNNSPVGDVNFGPFLAFHHPLGGPWSFHWVLEFDTYAPVGQYDNTKAFQLASNHWTIEPFLAFTLLGPAGTELSSRLHYTYNFANDDAVVFGTPGELQAGQLFHLNYALTKEVFTPRLKVGVVGYYIQQLTEDQFTPEGGPKTDIANSEEMAFAVGPVIWFNKGDFIFEAKCHFDVETENRPKAITGVLRIVYNFF